MRRRYIAAAALLCGVLAALPARPQGADGGAIPAKASPAASSPAEAGPAPPPPAARGARLQGTAYLGRNRQVVGATVTVQEQGEPARLFLTASDEKGRFRVEELPNGSYRVGVEREGLAPVVKTDVELRFPFRAVVEVPMQPLSAPGETGAGRVEGPPRSVVSRVTLRGETRELDGEPLGEARIRLVRRDGGEDPRQIATAADGTFEIADIPAGVWRLEARRVGFLPLRTALDLRGPTDLHVSLVRQPAGYDPSPLDLMPDEEPTPPKGLAPKPFAE